MPFMLYKQALQYVNNMKSSHLMYDLGVLTPT